MADEMPAVLLGKIYTYKYIEKEKKKKKWEEEEEDGDEEEEEEEDDDDDEEKEVRSGHFGSVAKYKIVQKNAVVAIKMLNKRLNAGIFPQAVREIGVLNTVRRHENIIRFIENFHDGERMYIVMEHAEHRLLDYVKLHKGKVKELLRQLLKGVFYCHSRHVIHRDIKPTNLMVNSEGILKIIDFGISRVSAADKIDYRKHTTMAGSFAYMAPEVLLMSSNYTRSYDMWSVGCVFSQMVTQKCLLQNQIPRDLVREIISIIGPPDYSTMQLETFSRWFPQWDTNPVKQEKKLEEMHDLCVDGLDLLKRMLEWDPVRRISAEDALKHRFFL